MEATEWLPGSKDQIYTNSFSPMTYLISHIKERIEVLERVAKDMLAVNGPPYKKPEQLDWDALRFASTAAELQFILALLEKEMEVYPQGKIEKHFMYNENDYSEEAWRFLPQKGFMKLEELDEQQVLILPLQPTKKETTE